MSGRSAARRLVPLALAAALALAAFFEGARPARGYVRYFTAAGKPHAWNSSCVWIHSHPYNLAGVSPEAVEAALDASATAWSGRSPQLAGCTYLDLRMVVEPETAPSPGAKYDRGNHFVIRSDRWCPVGVTDPMDCYDRSALALTSVFAIKSTGQIVDADIEVNAVNYAWGDLESTPDPDGFSHDLQNALTHEMGHFIGLDHTCFNGDLARARPADHTGAPIPDCGGAPEEVRETTMFASAMPGDLSKRTLAPDEQQAICEIYPAERDPLTCPSSVLPPAPGGGGCAVAPTPAPRDRGARAEPGERRLLLAIAGLAALGAALSLRRARRAR